MNLSTKYRPTSLNQIVGQDNVVKQIKFWENKKEFPHCIALTGNFGLGKTSLAHIIAHLANADIDEVNVANKRGIDDLRKLTDTFNYLPMHGSRRAIILEEVHQLTSNSASVLLRPLENPPAHIMIILCTNSPEKVPAGILQSGRAAILHLEKVQTSLIVKLLLNIAKAENILQPPESYRDLFIAVAKQSEGVPRLAISMLETAIAAVSGNILTPELLQSVILSIHKVVPEIAVNKLAVMTLVAIYSQNIDLLIKVVNDLGDHSVEFFVVRLLAFNLWLLRKLAPVNLDQQALLRQLQKYKVAIIDADRVQVHNSLLDLYKEIKEYDISADLLLLGRLARIIFIKSALKCHVSTNSPSP